MNTVRMPTEYEISMPRLYTLRLWWNEITGRDHAAATLRWRKNNAEQPRRCPCGADGTVAVRGWDVVGDVEPVFWRCQDHYLVSLTTPWWNGEPLTGQRRENCSWSTYRTYSRRITDCGCGTHIGELAGS